MNKQQLGEMVRFHRESAGLSRKELASLADVGMTAIYEMEKGISTFRIDTLLKVLHILNITLELTSPLMRQREVEHAQRDAENT